MKFNVDKDVCIGCGACQAIAPDIFEIEDDGLANVFGEVNKDNEEDAVEAFENCPTGAIKKE